MTFDLTGQVAALDAPQVHVDPEEFSQLVVDGQSDRFAQITEEQNLALRPVQSGALDLRRALLQIGEVHVPAERRTQRWVTGVLEYANEALS